MTDRAALNDREISALLLMCHEKEQDVTFAPTGMDDDPADEMQVFWAHIGQQLAALRHYSVCCACVALVHRDDRDIHPCGPCTCNSTDEQPPAGQGSGDE